MRFGSVCSGIEAASLAWHPLGWRAAWTAEIEPFPCAVLAHHYPDVPNLGDMTALPGRIASAENIAPSMGAKNPTAVAFSSKDYGADATTELAPTLRAMNHADSHANGGGQMAIATATQVRRLTPTECERLQGFPDGYTQIPWRKKPASECPDGPRYKALGNSWAVPNVRWIGERIHAAVLALEHANDNGQRGEVAA